MSYVFDEAVDRDEYDAFAAHHEQVNVLQSPQWAEVKKAWQHSLTGLRGPDGTLRAVGLVLKRPIKFGLTFWYMPHGPILDYSQDEVLRDYLEGLGKFARKNHAVGVRIDPFVALKAVPLEEFDSTDYQRQALHVKSQIEKAGYAHQGFVTGIHETLQPRFIPVTMAPADGQFESTLTKKARNLANNARNRRAEIEVAGSDKLDDFLSVIHETEKEKGISLRSRAYYENIMEVFGEAAKLYLAFLDIPAAIEHYEHEYADVQAQLEQVGQNETKRRRRLIEARDIAQNHITSLSAQREQGIERATLAGTLVVRYGKAMEMLYAGTNRQYSNIPAQHLAWVVALNDAFNNGVDYVSLGGVDGSLDDPLMQFKSRFNPVIYEKLGEFDLPIIKPLYWVISAYLKRR